MASLDPAAVRRWRDGLREADRVAGKLEKTRLRNLQQSDAFLEYAGLEALTGTQPAEVLERGHRDAARRWTRVLEVYRKAAARRTPS